jgi:maltose alpha-D-glucosyltransferase/alpha-amylase
MKTGFEAELLGNAQFGHVLKEYVAASRWFRAKTRTIEGIDIEDAFALPDADASILVLQIRYASGPGDRYILPMAFSEQASDNVVARVRTDDGAQITLVNSLASEQFRKALLDFIVCERRVEGMRGAFTAARTAALDEKCGDAAGNVESFVSRAEQSNTSIIYRDRYILKLFRKLEPGVNPDLEIGAYLTEHEFANTPAVLGSIAYERDGESFAAGILQTFVRNEGDAWKYTLEQLAGFFDRALGSAAELPVRSSDHPLELAKEPVPARMRELIGSYLDSAALLGRRTAEMHTALAGSAAGPEFAPEPFGPEDAKRLHQDLVGQADITFELLRRRQAALPAELAESVKQLLHKEPRVAQRFAAIEHYPVTAVRIRHHGDYHLGQILYTGRDFMIIDFEGEPARPLEERRAKALALRDVAGMLRSFQYAAFAALFGQVPGFTVGAQSRAAVENWAAAWNAYVSATYLKAYLATASDTPFLPVGAQEQRDILDAFLLQKALYELAYELNNRPDWLQIPLQGILTLVS